MAESLARAGWTVFFVALASSLGETARVLPLAAICFFGGTHFFGMAPSFGEALLRHGWYSVHVFPHRKRWAG
jgi:hypothetical protein